MAERPVHPGTITYVDGDTNAVVSVAQAANLPEQSAFAPNAKGIITPIVKVVARSAGSARFVKELGPNDELLRSTTLTVPA